MAEEWLKKGFVPQAFVDYISDETQVAFPWTMIDKITPRPADSVCAELEKLGCEAIAPVITSKRTYIAPFVNAEKPQYLVVEDRFPNGRTGRIRGGRPRPKSCGHDPGGYTYLGRFHTRPS